MGIFRKVGSNLGGKEMKKFSIVMVAAFLAGSTGMVRAAQIDSFDKAGDDNMSSGGDRPSEAVRKAGGTQMTTNDKDQITGNLSDTNKGLDSKGDHFPKGRLAKSKSSGKSKVYFIKYNSKTNTYDKWTKAGGKTVPYTVGSASGGAGSGKASLNNSTISGNGGKGNAKMDGVNFSKEGSADTFHKQNGFEKSAPGGSNGALVPAVQH